MQRRIKSIHIVSSLAILAAMGQAAHADDLLIENGTAREVSTSETFTNVQVGTDASGQILNVVAGGTLSATNSFLGVNAGSLNNTATVSGTGATWTSSEDLNVGFYGASSTLNVGTGGQVTASDIKMGGGASSNNNTINVNGGTITTAGDMILGYAGTSNVMNLVTGGDALSGNAYIGLEATADYNSASLTGTGSVWVNSGLLQVGSLGSSNALSISGGADMTVAADALIGASAGSNYNSIELSDDGSTLSTATLYVGRGGSNNDLDIYDGADVTSSQVRIGGGTGSSGTTANYNSASISGQGSTWTIASTLRVGAGTASSSSFNSLGVYNGAVVTAGTKTFVGYDANSDSNSIIISGTGATLNAGELIIGNGGSTGNSVTVTGDGNLNATAVSVAGDNELSLGSAAEINATSITFATNSLFTVELDAADKAEMDIANTATLAGQLKLGFGEGDTISKRYSLFTAGNISGTFDSVNDDEIPEGFTSTVQYSGTEAYLEFTGELGADGTFTKNAEEVVDSINYSFNFGSFLTWNFASLFGMLSDLEEDIDQLAAETGPGSAGLGVFQMSNSFMGMMSNPYLSSQSTYSAATVDGQQISPAADVVDTRWNAWGAALGGTSNTSGDEATGSSDVGSKAFGIATGWEKAISPTGTMGFATAIGGTSWDIADAMGQGTGSFLQAGLYGSHQLDNGYVSLAASYGWHRMSASRTIDVVGIETLDSDFNMHSLAGRLETGRNLAKGVTPYAALQVQGMYTPAYAEESDAVDDGFALAYDDSTSTSARTELGLRLEAKPHDTTTLSGRLAWAHDVMGDQSVDMSFVALDAGSFTVEGAERASDSALISLGTAYRPAADTTISLNVESELSQESQAYGGGVTIAVAW